VSDVPFPLQSARDKGGRRFQPVREQILEEVALRASTALPGAVDGLLVLREVVGPLGIPDLVAVVGNSQAVTLRRKLRVPPLLNEIDAAMVGAASPRAPRRTETLARRLHWPVATLARRLPNLIRSGALIETSPGVVVRPEALQPIGRLYAIETKVADWRRAVRQGRAYQLWCDAYLVVMESLSSGALPKLLEATAEDGGGVVIGGRWLSRPKVRRRPDWKRLWGSEHVVAALGHGSEALGSPVHFKSCE
jgi:hypothetical protein